MCCLQGHDHGEVGGGVKMIVGAFVSVFVEEITSLAINVLDLPPSLPSLLALIRQLSGGEWSLGVYDKRQVLILSQEAPLSSNIRARDSFSLFFILPPFPFIFWLHQLSSAQNMSSV